MKHRYGLRGPDAESGRAQITRFVPTLTTPLPRKLSYLQLFPERIDQGNVGRCVPTVITEIYAAVLAKHFKIAAPRLSARALYTLTQINREPQTIGQDDGLYGVDALWTHMHVGYVERSAWPEEYDLGADYFKVPPANLIKRIDDIIGYRYIAGPANGSTADYVTITKRALEAHGPLAIGGKFYYPWEECGPSGNLTPNPSESDLAGMHERARVGWDDDHENLDGTRGAFQDLNSWGPDWGFKGTYFMPYSTVAAANPDDAYVMTVPLPAASVAA